MHDSAPSSDLNQRESLSMSRLRPHLHLSSRVSNKTRFVLQSRPPEYPTVLPQYNELASRPELFDKMSSFEFKEDDPSDVETICEDLDSWFRSTSPKGVIMCSSTYASSPNPAIEIGDAGTVGLPLSSRDVDTVKQASHPAPFGKGSETLMDGKRPTKHSGVSCLGF